MNILFFFNFLITDFCNAPSNCSLGLKFFFIPIPLDFPSNNLYTIKASPLLYPSYLGLIAILKAF